MKNNTAIKLALWAIPASLVWFAELVVVLATGGFYVPDWSSRISRKCMEHSLKWRD